MLFHRLVIGSYSTIDLHRAAGGSSGHADKTHMLSNRNGAGTLRGIGQGRGRLRAEG